MPALLPKKRVTVSSSRDSLDGAATALQARARRRLDGRAHRRALEARREQRRRDEDEEDAFFAGCGCLSARLSSPGWIEPLELGPCAQAGGACADGATAEEERSGVWFVGGWDNASEEDAPDGRTGRAVSVRVVQDLASTPDAALRGRCSDEKSLHTR